MRWMGLLAALGVAAGMLTAALAQDGARERRRLVTDAVAPDAAAIETSLDALRRITMIPGDPVRVWWTYEPVVDNSKGFPPGPTDYRLVAVVEYASAAEVEALLARATSYDAEIDAPGWWPEMLSAQAHDGRLAVAQRSDVEGFWSALVSTASGAPMFVVVQATTT